MPEVFTARSVGRGVDSNPGCPAVCCSQCSSPCGRAPLAYRFPPMAGFYAAGRRRITSHRTHRTRPGSRSTTIIPAGLVGNGGRNGVLRFLWTYFFVMNANFSCRRGNEVQLLLRECQLLRDVFGRGFHTWEMARASARIFIDTSGNSVIVRDVLLGEGCSVFSVQFSVECGAKSGDGTGSVHLLYAARERGSRWRRDLGSGWYFSRCRTYEFCFFWYEFCFILYVFCFVFGEKPCFWAKNGVWRTARTGFLSVFLT